MNINRLDTSDLDFYTDLAALTAWSEARDDEVHDRVRAILDAVRERGDAALVELTNRFDRRDVQSISELEISRAQMDKALASIPQAQREALQAAAEGRSPGRVRAL